MRLILLAACVVLAGCDIQLNMPAATAVPTAPGAVTVTTTQTQTVDRSDTGPVGTPTPSGSPPAPTTGALPLPAYGESVTREYAAANPHQVTNSCQVTHGEAAWAFLDGLIRVLGHRDARWGYLCKDANCTKVAADVVAYRASSGNTGIHIVDVLGNHCSFAGDSPTQVRWGVLPFETARPWIGVRP